ncbi:sugar transferase [Corynebacterium hindlerae]|uniref:Sugar transferase n=1 Tax=Corynebacterium hindlerae TaxID=699041 RepID=A0A7G5FHP0_9CORY|nr:sugar transferase [Corynebacterium hindlerae]QMV86131.1 sugar transferase [Corynebacterium hindlerae]
MRTQPHELVLTPVIADSFPLQQTHVHPPRTESATYLVIKRVFDASFAFSAIIILSPLLAVIALLIKLQDGGPVLFTQLRVGHNQKPIRMYKFRTMRTDAEKMLPHLMEVTAGSEERAGNNVLFKLKDDPRVTKLGTFLRQYSLDELPQLFNVLQGNMSLIGPRPPLPREVENFDQRALHKFDVKPGITGLWQTMGRSNLPWEEAIALDLHYVEHRSIAMDTKIFFRTFKVVLSREGAY